MIYNEDLLTINHLRQNLPHDFKVLTEQQQFQGRNFNPRKWDDKLLPDENFGNIDCSSPENIISCFENNQFLQALALIVSWGTMARTNRFIYRKDLETIRDALKSCKEDIKKTGSIEKSWHLLSSELEWSPVIISKTLHFLCRSLGFEVNPPVPLDNGIMVQKVWPRLFEGVRQTRNFRWLTPDDSWIGYCRYMTFIEYLRKHFYPKWTNTNVENALFGQFQ